MTASGGVGFVAAMLSVIVDARPDVRTLPALLAQLTAGAVEGLIREVLIVAEPGEPLVAELCDATGAEPFVAAETLKSAHVLVLPAALRLRDGWISALENHLSNGGVEALVVGLAQGGLFRRPPFGVLVERRRLENGRGADLDRLRRDLGLRARRIG